MERKEVEEQDFELIEASEVNSESPMLAHLKESMSITRSVRKTMGVRKKPLEYKSGKNSPVQKIYSDSKKVGNIG